MASQLNEQFRTCHEMYLYNTNKNANKISGINGEINLYKFEIKNFEISLSLPNNLNGEW